MLHCVYHPVNEMRVVEDAEKEELLATGTWFGHPDEAKEYKKKCIEKIKKEDAKNDGKNGKLKQKVGRKPKKTNEQ